MLGAKGGKGGEGSSAALLPSSKQGVMAFSPRERKEGGKAIRELKKKKEGETP